MRIAIVCAILSLYLCTVTFAQCPWTEPGVKKWSNPSSWPNNTIPAVGSNVTIPSGLQIVYDLAASSYNSITVLSGGQLIFDAKNVSISARYIQINDGGAFRIGSSTCLYNYTSSVTLIGPKDTTTSINGHGTKGILSAGALEFWGNPPQPTWTKVSATVNVGATSFTVQDTLTNWKVGDSIVLASTDYYMDLSEVFTIVAISGKTITVNKPVAYLHWGANNEYAEVAHLTRNVLIQGDNSSIASSFGGHCLLYGNGTAHIYGIEFTRMGQKNVLARYPFHFHMMGNQIGKGHFVSECSSHDNYQRCYTVHGTSGVLLQNNVGFNTIGHCYFLEDGSESWNTYDHNIGITAKPGSMISSDVRPAIFWITNPNNTFINNVGVGANFGFWFSLPVQPMGPSASQTWIYPRTTRILRFDNNVAHGSYENGIHNDEGPDKYGNTFICTYVPLTNPADSSSYPVRTVWNGNIAYKNRGYGIWMRGSYITVNGSLLMDNGIGINLAAGGNLVTNTVIIGETPNIGTPNHTPFFSDMGRSRPQLWILDFPIHGFETYDNTGQQFSRNNTYMNFTSDSVRYAGAFGFFQNGPDTLAPSIIIAQTTLINANAWTIRDNPSLNDGPSHAIITDADGSLTGSYGSSIVTSNPIFMYANNCTVHPEWKNFSLCQQNPNGYSLIAVENHLASGTDFGTSLNATFRAWFTPFGQPQIVDYVQGDDKSSIIRGEYDTNVISRHGYVISFPHPTPPMLRVCMRYAATGEWAVVAIPYPRTSNFTLTRGYYNTPVTPVTSPALLTENNYYYDSTQQLLYVKYLEDNGQLNYTAGFPQYAWGTSYINIAANCGKLCIVSPVPATPAALPDNEHKYRASLKGCVAGVVNSFLGEVYLNYNPITQKLTYLIYHSIPQSTWATIESSSGLVYNLTHSQAPIRGAFTVSWNKLNELWNGNWSVSVGTANPSQTIKGMVGCSGVCAPPPSISSYDPCAAIPGEAVIFTDALNSTIGWMDWTWSVTKNYTYTADKLCGKYAISAIFQPYGALSYNVGLGSCVPGNCTAYWQKPWINVSNYEYFQFDVKSPSGPIGTALTVTAQNNLEVSIGSVVVTQPYIDNWVIENSWTRVKVPLSAIGFKGTELVGTFGITPNGWVSGMQVLFDNIKLVPAYNDPLTKQPYGTVKYYSAPSC